MCALTLVALTAPQAADAQVTFDRAFGIGVDTGAAVFENCTAVSGCQTGIASGAAGATSQPHGVVVDAQDRIIVADLLNNRIARFTVAPDGTVSFDRAFGVDVDPTDGTTGDFENCTASGCQVGTPSDAAGGMNGPFGIANDAQGRVVVADPSNRRIDRFTVAPDGTVSFDRAFGIGVDTGAPIFENCTAASGCQIGTASSAAGGMADPRGVAVDAQGRILVAGLSNRIDRFTVAPDGTVSFDRAFGIGVDTGAPIFENCTAASGCQIGTASSAAGGMRRPWGVVVDTQGRILVSDEDNERVNRYTVAPDGTVSFDRAFGVDVDPTDGTTGDFENCTASGCQVGTPSGAAGGMNGPEGVTVDAQARILVADSVSNRIDRFTVAPDGTVSFDRAFGIGVDTGAPVFENCTAASGCQIGTASSAAGGMADPRGVALDAQGRFLAADSGHRRIDRFALGDPATSPGTGGGGGGGGNDTRVPSPAPGSAGAPPALDSFPRISQFYFDPPRFESANAGSPRAAARQTGTTIRSRGDEAGTADVRLYRFSRGIRVGDRCVRRTRARVRRNPRARRCTYLTSLGTLTYAVEQGAAARPWRGSHPRTGRALRPGHFCAVLTVTDAAGQRSEPLDATFRVLRRREAGRPRRYGRGAAQTCDVSRVRLGAPGRP